MLKSNSNAILRIASVALFFFIWELASSLMSVDLLPSPNDVFLKIIEESKSSELFFHTFITLKKSFYILLNCNASWNFCWYLHGKKREG